VLHYGVLGIREEGLLACSFGAALRRAAPS